MYIAGIEMKNALIEITVHKLPDLHGSKMKASRDLHALVIGYLHAGAASPPHSFPI
jgi:hypothetical protein